eukprot:5021743-Amphidinium_carterae.1
MHLSLRMDDAEQLLMRHSQRSWAIEQTRAREAGVENIAAEEGMPPSPQPVARALPFTFKQ